MSAGWGEGGAGHAPPPPPDTLLLQGDSSCIKHSDAAYEAHPHLRAGRTKTRVLSITSPVVGSRIGQASPGQPGPAAAPLDEDAQQRATSRLPDIPPSPSPSLGELVPRVTDGLLLEGAAAQQQQQPSGVLRRLIAEPARSGVTSARTLGALMHSPCRVASS